MIKAGKETIKYINKQNILSFFRKREDVSKAEIAETIGLSPATVSLLTQELVDEGYLVENRYGESSGGRKPMLYNLNRELAYILAVKITPKGAVLAVMNLSGEIVYHRVLRMQIHDTGSLEKILAEAVGEMRMKNPALAEKITFAAYSVPGVLEYENAKIVYSAALFVEEFDLKKITAELMGRELKIYLFKDTDALLLNEYYEDDKKERNMVFLYCENGVGMSVTNRGKLLRIEGCGLEIGHTTIDIHGAKCKCSATGCVGTLLGEVPALQRYEEIRQSLEQGGEFPDITAMSYQSLVERCLNEADPAAEEVVQEQIKLLSIVTANVVNLFNPGVVVIGGALTRLTETIPEVTRHVKETALKPFTRNLTIQAARQDRNAALYGMANYILDREFFKRLSI
ncbi:MAG: ROK family transcriptional regulator [Lachnospiraceae bacterium]|nr:ROK family transcriptional regulator [Lachnospiraceae bacterium]